MTTEKEIMMELATALSDFCAVARNELNGLTVIQPEIRCAETALATYRQHMKNTPDVKTRPWSKPDDVPGPVCWLRTRLSKNNEDMITHVDPSGLFKGNGNDSIFYEMLGLYEHSTDRKTWKPCEVTE